MTLGFAMFVATFMVAVVAAIMAVCYALVWLLRELRVFTGLQSTRFGMRPVEITRPPQSWRYVEELSNE